MFYMIQDTDMYITDHLRPPCHPPQPRLLWRYGRHRSTHPRRRPKLLRKRNHSPWQRTLRLQRGLWQQRPRPSDHLRRLSRHRLQAQHGLLRRLHPRRPTLPLLHPCPALPQPQPQEGEALWPQPCQRLHSRLRHQVLAAQPPCSWAP